jgi:hypothetical protein
MIVRYVLEIDRLLLCAQKGIPLFVPPTESAQVRRGSCTGRARISALGAGCLSNRFYDLVQTRIAALN